MKQIPENNLRYWRVRKLMTQKDLVEASGISQVTISRTENSLSEPTDKTKKELAKALGVKPKKLFPPKVREMDFKPSALE